MGTEDKSLVKSVQCLRLFSSRRQPPLLVKTRSTRLKGFHGGTRENKFMRENSFSKPLMFLKASSFPSFSCDSIVSLSRLVGQFRTMIFYYDGFTLMVRLFDMNPLLILLTAAMISLLFGGGTVLLNFVVSTIVFLTALFYLLSISEKGNSLSARSYWSRLSRV